MKFPWLPPHAADPRTPDVPDFRGFLIFLADFGLREVSQWRDLEILLQMAFGRARGDFSRPQTRPGTMST